MHTSLPCALHVCKELAVSLSLPLENLQMCTSLAKQKHVAQHGTALSKDTAVSPIGVLLIAALPITVLPIAVVTIVSKSIVMHCR